MTTDESKKSKKEVVEELDMAAILKKKKPVTERVTIQLDGEIKNDLEALEEQLVAARRYDRLHNEEDTAPQVEQAIEELREKAKTTEQVFTFQSIGREPYDDLVQAHPPTAKQKKEEQAQFNTETFPPALVAAASVKPKISLKQATQMFSDPSWNNAELLRLWFAALHCNSETADTPLSGKGSVSTEDLLSSLLTATNEASPTAST